MGRILALDFGEKRTGVAVTDPLKIIASGLTTVATKSLIDFLKNYLNSEEVDLFVIGEPKQMNNSPSESEVYIQPFLKQLTKTFPQIPIERVDERFTSKIAFQTMIDTGISRKKRQNKSLIDQISATIILQSYLDRK
ncbi:MAG: Holliday junction resolvase RuvX [Flavobacteriaceae bacterium]|jgi:putative Holliday junction resolvase